MKETVQQTVQYLQDNLLVTLVLAYIAGFAGTKTVAFGKKGNPVVYFVVGLLGAFVGQFAILFLGLTEILDEVASFRLFFDLLAAYIGSFIFGWLYFLFKPH